MKAPGWSALSLLLLVVGPTPRPAGCGLGHSLGHSLDHSLAVRGQAPPGTGGGRGPAELPSITAEPPATATTSVLPASPLAASATGFPRDASAPTTARPPRGGATARTTPKGPTGPTRGAAALGVGRRRVAGTHMASAMQPAAASGVAAYSVQTLATSAPWPLSAGNASTALHGEPQGSAAASSIPPGPSSPSTGLTRTGRTEIEKDADDMALDAALANSTLNATANATAGMANCTNDYCVSDSDYLDMMEAYLFPTTLEWVFIALHGVVFISGLVGNALVCVAVYRNHTMRTVTNYFIVNLAVADFLVILLCLPPTVMWDVTETWFMGTALCKIVLYFQTVSVTVSVLTLTFISVDRWYAICYPLKFKSTTSRAKKAIVLIWVLALLFDLPELVVLETRKKDLSIDVVYFTQCLPSWGNVSDTTFHCVKTLMLFFLPLAFMTVAYVQIVRVLWSKSNIPGHCEMTKSVHEQHYNGSTNGVNTSARRTMSRSISSSSQILGRRKAAKMLVMVDIVFAFCYFPVHIYSILRYTIDIPQSEFTTAFAMGAHWLCYFNSAINPVIYNFMSGKFREEFRRAFQQCWCVGCVGGDAVRPAAPAAPAAPVGVIGHAVGAGLKRRGRVSISLHSTTPTRTGRPASGGRVTSATSTLAVTATSTVSSVIDSRT